MASPPAVKLAPTVIAAAEPEHLVHCRTRAGHFLSISNAACGKHDPPLGLTVATVPSPVLDASWNAARNASSATLRSIGQFWSSLPMRRIAKWESHATEIS